VIAIVSSLSADPLHPRDEGPRSRQRLCDSLWVELDVSSAEAAAIAWPLAQR
jgi:hypothetical protein